MRRGVKAGKLTAVDSRYPVTIGIAPAPVRRYGPRMSHPAAATHNKVIGYLFWFFGFTGAHRFYYGKPLSGVIWLFTAGLLGIGWIIDAFLIPGMDDEANRRYTSGSYDYSVAWLLLARGGEDDSLMMSACHCRPDPGHGNGQNSAAPFVRVAGD